MKKMQCKSCLKALKAPTDDNDGDEVMCTACGGASRLSAIVGLKATATEAELTGELAALSGARTQIIALTGEKSLSAALGVLSAWKTKVEGYDELAKEKADVEAATLTTALTAALDTASTDGKVPPAGKESLKAAVLKMGGGKVTKEGLEWLTAHVGALPKLVTTGAGTAQAAAADDAETLTAEEKATAARHGISEKSMLTAKQQRAARLKGGAAA